MTHPLDGLPITIEDGNPWNALPVTIIDPNKSRQYQPEQRERDDSRRQLDDNKKQLIPGIDDYVLNAAIHSSSWSNDSYSYDSCFHDTSSHCDF